MQRFNAVVWLAERASGLEKNHCSNHKDSPIATQPDPEINPESMPVKKSQKQ